MYQKKKFDLKEENPKLLEQMGIKQFEFEQQLRKSQEEDQDDKEDYDLSLGSDHEHALEAPGDGPDLDGASFS